MVESRNTVRLNWFDYVVLSFGIRQINLSRLTAGCPTGRAELGGLCRRDSYPDGTGVFVSAVIHLEQRVLVLHDNVIMGSARLINFIARLVIVALLSLRRCQWPPLLLAIGFDAATF